ncbi:MULTISPECIES: hypothetical protein [Sphingomonas]|uniref:hypothetical protein n=1 Tax=Sphingomonas TaxID=13687 RepID=UPI000DEFC90C|nr:MULTISPECIES: hypothetical protein [Sphingomonas]
MEEPQASKQPLAETLSVQARGLLSAPAHTAEDEAERARILSSETDNAATAPPTKVKSFNASAWLARLIDRTLMLLAALVFAAMISPDRRPPAEVVISLVALVGVGLKAFASINEGFVKS